MDPSLVEQYDRDGFVLFREFLHLDELDEFIVNIDRFIRDDLPGLPDSQAKYHDKTRPETLYDLRPKGNSAFESYSRHPRLIEVAEILLREPAESNFPVWMNKPPGIDYPTPPHQDCYYEWLVPPNALAMWLALDDADEENGCIRYIPGSHRSSVRPHGDTDVVCYTQAITDYGPRDMANEVAVCVQPGDLIVHHCRVIHRADVNRSPTRSRRAVTQFFRGVSAQRDLAARDRPSSQPPLGLSAADRPHLD